jgi:predicted RNase H-like HicB family nuclease
MSTHTFTIVIEPDEDMFHGYVPALKGCHTFGKTVDETRLHLAEAIELYLEGLVEPNRNIS